MMLSEILLKIILILNGMEIVLMELTGQTIMTRIAIFQVLGIVLDISPQQGSEGLLHSMSRMYWFIRGVMRLTKESVFMSF